MKNYEEKHMFDVVDSLDVSELEADLIEWMEDQFPPLTQEDGSGMKRIQARTLAGLLQDEEIPALLLDTAPVIRRRRLPFIAAIIAGLIAAGALCFTPSVQADLKKVLRFIPGFGVVQEGDATQLTYVLEKPVVQAIGKGGKVIVDGIILQPDHATISLRGLQTADVTEFTAEIEGHNYTFTSSLRSSSGGDWVGSYNAIEPIHLPMDKRINLNINGIRIGPLLLIPPRTADEVEQLGASSTQQNVKITAFPTDLGDGIIRVQLIPSLPSPNLSVGSYGIPPLVPNDGLTVEDAKSTKATLQQSGNLMYDGDFQFREISAESNVQPYTVVIPYLEVVDHEAVSKEVVIPLPNPGVLQPLDIPAEITGLPLHFTSVERTGDTGVSLGVDMGFDSSKPKTLLNFAIRYPESKINDSFSWLGMDTTIVMKTLFLEIKPGQTELRFSMAEPHYLLKGPWRMPLNIE